MESKEEDYHIKAVLEIIISKCFLTHCTQMISAKQQDMAGQSSRSSTKA